MAADAFGIICLYIHMCIVYIYNIYNINMLHVYIPVLFSYPEKSENILFFCFNHARFSVHYIL